MRLGDAGGVVIEDPEGCKRGEGGSCLFGGCGCLLRTWTISDIWANSGWLGLGLVDILEGSLPMIVGDG